MATILVIDDADAVREFIREVLEQSGHTVFDAANGLEGLRIYAREQVELVICDLEMPVKNGAETIRELRAANPEAPVLVISGSGPAAWAKLKTMNRLNKLRKPFRREELAAAVNQILSDRASSP